MWEIEKEIKNSMVSDLSMNLIKHYYTHLAMLTAIISRTTGPVLEMGCGFVSTVALHQMCSLTDRIVVSLDGNREWLDKFRELTTKWHSFYLVVNNNWEECKIIDGRYWSVVYVDHAPGERRRFDIERLMNNAEFIVVHDSEAECYEYEPVFKKFRYRYDYEEVVPRTTVLSQTRSLFDFKGGK